MCIRVSRHCEGETLLAHLGVGPPIREPTTSKAKNTIATYRNHGLPQEAPILTEDKHEDTVINAHGPHERGCVEVIVRWAGGRGRGRGREGMMEEVTPDKS